MSKRTEPNALETITQKMIAHMCTLMIVLGLASYVGTQVYITAEEPSPTQDVHVMDNRPHAPGSDAAVWEQHEEKCWRFEPKGVATGAILRINPNDPFVYTTRPRLVERAIEQAVHKKSRGIDRVFAFCTDHITQKGK